MERIPWATIGYDADIAGLITGKNHHKAEIGWHECGNHAEELNGLLDGIRKDIHTYVLAFFAKSHKKINADKRRVTINSYMQAQFETLSESDIQAIKNIC